MGISTLRSYRGAKIFEAIGLSDELLRTYFGTAAGSIGGIHLDQIARDYGKFHDEGYTPDYEDRELQRLASLCGPV